MKVFISWSGERSNKIAEALKQWIKHVIQTVEPFVSSQDVSKGARWSTDIAKELQDTNFGILCVTKDNYQQPWLLFEAGALSKTIEKSYVVPLLFDLGPSDLQDSPLLQFQATSFSKDEIKKLILTINSACEASSLDARELDEAFEVWYPKLEEALSKIEFTKEEPSGTKVQSESEKITQILEELLELTRINQKILRNPDNKIVEEVKNLGTRIESITRRIEETEFLKINSSKKPMIYMIEELLHNIQRRDTRQRYTLLIALAPFKEFYPWLYDAGKDLMDILHSKRSLSEKEASVREFIDLIEFSTHYSCKYDFNEYSYESTQSLKELSSILQKYILSYYLPASDRF